MTIENENAISSIYNEKTYVYDRLLRELTNLNKEELLEFCSNFINNIKQCDQ